MCVHAFTKLMQRCGHYSQGLQRGILLSLGQVASAQGWKSQGELITPRTVMCDLFMRGLQVVGMDKHKLLMRNGDHSAHVALTAFTRLKNPKYLQISSGHSCVEMCKTAHLGQARGCSSPRVLRHLQQQRVVDVAQGPSTLHWKPGSRALFPAIPLASCCL